ncbi:hypothetical protein ACOMHN_019108 [Nucella lapillus]
MKRLGLVKEDVFTGVEADALKKLLKTLRWKTWNPQLYFHIRFFSIRNKLHPMSEETKALTMLSIDAQEMLRDQLPEQRTPQAIDKAVLSMQYVNDFAKLPSELQYQLVKAAYTMWFLADGKTETTAILRKGDGFGGAAIFNKCRRLTTVVSQTPVHLLVVPKDMIAKHFDKSLHLLYANVIQFLSKMWFMQAWPLEHLIKCPHQCKRKTFRRTEIIEVDGAKAEWIYVVARGLEDLCLDPKHPPVKRNLILISDEAECVMVSKNFYLQMASPQLRKKVYGLLMARKKVFTQITSSECSLIPLGGIHRNPKILRDPIDPELCIHC